MKPEAPTPDEVAARLQSLAQLYALGTSLAQSRVAPIDPSRVGLPVIGRVGPRLLEAVSKGLSVWPLSAGDRAFLCAHAGRTFHVGDRLTRARTAAGEDFAVSVTIVAATQAWSQPMNEVPRGHKAVVVLRGFEEGDPLERLSTTDSWGAPSLWLLR